MERKIILITIVVFACLVLFSVVAWIVFLNETDNKSSARIPSAAQVEPGQAGERLLEQAENSDFDADSDYFKNARLDDIVGLFFKACTEKRITRAKNILSKHLGSCDSSDTLNILAECLVQDTQISNVEAFKRAAELLGDNDKRTVLLRSAVLQENTLAFNALLMAQPPIISNGAVIYDQEVGKIVTIFDFVAGQGTKIRRHFMPLLLRKLQVNFVEYRRLAEAVAKDGPEYIKLILEQGECETERLAVILKALYEKAADPDCLETAVDDPDCSGSDYINLVNAIKLVVPNKGIQEHVVLEMEFISGLAKDKVELKRALLHLTPLFKQKGFLRGLAEVAAAMSLSVAAIGGLAAAALYLTSSS